MVTTMLQAIGRALYMAAAMGMGFSWDYTTWLNLVLLAPAAIFVWRFLATGGPKMLRMMESSEPHGAQGCTGRGSGGSDAHS